MRPILKAAADFKSTTGSKKKKLKVHVVKKQKILIAMTGASGILYAESLIEALLPLSERIYLVFSDTAKKVALFELDKTHPDRFSLRRALAGKLTEDEKKTIKQFDGQDFFAPTASGTSVPDAMVVLPCSMGTLARIACGISSSLIERSADVVLKQKKKLIICPRETPLNQIHLKNLLTLSKLGAHIVPTMPGFYHKPKTVEDIVNFMTGRLMETLDLPHKLYEPWAQKRL